MGPIQDLRIGTGFSAHDGEGATASHPQVRIDVGGMARADSELFIHVVDVPEKIHKQQQFTIEDHTQWPDNLPWPVKTVWDMPVVIWLTKNAA